MGRRRRFDIPTLLNRENTVAWNLFETEQGGAEQELSCRAMHDLLLSRPMTKIGEDLGISDVALKRICVKHRVPTPARILGKADTSLVLSRFAP